MDTLSLDRPSRVLIVDDYRNWRDKLSDSLRKTPRYELDFEIETAANYDEAQRKLRECAYHVVVADQRLVDADPANIEGILLWDEVHKIDDGAQVIVVTGYPSIEAANEALKGRGVYAYITKHPFDIEDYREKVKRAALKAWALREQRTNKSFLLKKITAGLTREQIAGVLFPEVLEEVSKVLNILQYPLQPWAYTASGFLTADRICELLLWSRGLRKAVLLRLGRELDSLRTWRSSWLIPSGNLKERESSVFERVAGITYLVDGMTFEEFAALVKEHQYGI